MSRKFCYIEPVYPKKAYVVYLFAYQEGGLAGPIILSTLFETPLKASNEIKKQVKAFTTGEFDISPDCILLPVTFHSLLPLKEAYWKSPTIHYDVADRMKLFTKVLKHPLLHYLVVTPTILKKNGKASLCASFPIMDPSDTKSIEQFMYTSDQVVDIKSKSAAIYSFGESVRFNWEKNIVSEVDKNEVSNNNLTSN